MRAIPLLAMFAAMAMAADIPPPPKREPIGPEPDPDPDPDPKFFVGVDHGRGSASEAPVLVDAIGPGVVVVRRDESGWRPEPVFRRSWHPRAVASRSWPDTTYRPNHPRAAEDRQAIDAAQAKRDRKNAKRLQELR